VKRFLKYYLLIYIALIILLNPESALRYSKNALLMIEEILIPSLFPFFVCSGLLIYSGLAETLSLKISFIMKPLFNINGSGAAAVVLGLLSGYPLGAQTAIKLYKNGSLTKTECERLMAFSNNSGPLFIMGTVGLSIFKSQKAGIILYICHILSALTVGIIFRFYKREDVLSLNKEKNPAKSKSLGEIYKNALSDSIKSIAFVSGTVLFFSVILNITADLLPDSIFSDFLVLLGEVTTGIKRVSASQLDFIRKLLLSALSVGFAGLSVHLQVISIAYGKGISLKPYLMGKFMHAIFAVLYTALALKISPITQTAFANGSSLSGAFFFASVFTGFTFITLILLATVTLIIGKISQGSQSS